MDTAKDLGSLFWSIMFHAEIREQSSNRKYDLKSLTREYRQGQ